MNVLFMDFDGTLISDNVDFNLGDTAIFTQTLECRRLISDEQICALLDTYETTPGCVHILTGRPERYRNVIEEYLTINNIRSFFNKILFSYPHYAYIHSLETKREFCARKALIMLCNSFKEDNCLYIDSDKEAEICTNELYREFKYLKKLL